MMPRENKREQMEGIQDLLQAAPLKSLAEALKRRSIDVEWKTKKKM